MISNKLVTEFGGKFTVESELGRGAEFKFTINISKNNRETISEKREGAEVVNAQGFSYQWSPKENFHKPVKYTKMRGSKIRISKLKSATKIFESEISVDLCSEIEDEDANFNINLLDFN